MPRKAKKSLAAVLAAGAVVVSVGGVHLNSAYEGRVVRIIDADTQEITIDLVAGLSLVRSVRALGIDTPEKRRPDKSCSDGGIGEKQLGEIASQYVSHILPIGSPVRITDISEGKFAGRVLGNVWFKSADGEWLSLSQDLINQGYAKEYWGGKKESWCVK